MKRILSMLLGVLMVMTLMIGCQKTTDGDATTNNVDTKETKNSDSNSNQKEVVKETEDEKVPVTLRVAWWGSQGRHDYTLQLLDMYTKLNPHVTFEAEYTGWDDYWTKLSYQAAANDLPDIMQTVVGRPEPAPLIEAGLFADLKPFVGNKLNLSEVADGLISTGEVAEKLVGVALSSNALAIVYDPDLLKQAGVEVPEFGYTWDDYIAICKKINSELGIYGTGDIETQNILYNYYPRQFGEHFFADDEDGLGISKEVLSKYLSMKLELQKAGLMPDVAEISQEMGVEDHPLVHGKAAFAWKWAPNLGTLEEPAGKKFELLPLPGPNAEKAQFVKAGMHFSVAESSAVKKEAVKFIDWFINDIEANKIINADRGVPSSAAVRKEMLPILGETQQKVFEYVDFVGANSTPQDTFLPVKVNDILESISDLEEKVLFKKITLEEAVEKFFSSMQ